jgi:hypothetical protein
VSVPKTQITTKLTWKCKKPNIVPSNTKTLGLFGRNPSGHSGIFVFHKRRRLEEFTRATN